MEIGQSYVICATDMLDSVKRMAMIADATVLLKMLLNHLSFIQGNDTFN